MTDRLHAYLLAETLRRVEEETGGPGRNPAAAQQAIVSGTTFPDRILARALLLAPETGTAAALQRTTARLRAVQLGFIAVCFVLGAGITHALPAGYPARANVFSLLALMLVPNLLSLALRLALTAYGRLRHGLEPAGAWLGRQALAIKSLVEALQHLDTCERAAVHAWREYLTRTASGRRRLVIASHECWIAALAGSLAGCWWLLTIRQVDFAWGSTLLTTAEVERLLGALTRWVSAFGIPVPSLDDIGASRIDAVRSDAELRRRWGTFIIGSIATLALVPRLLVLAADLFGYWRLTRALQPDITQPGYVRLRPELLPLSHGQQIIDPDADADPEPGRPPDRTALNMRLTQPIPVVAAWVALEHAPEPSCKLGRIHTDLGVLDSQAAVTLLSGRLTGPAPDWDAVCVLADLAITPDRGIARLLAQINKVSTRPVHLVLYASSRAAAMAPADRELRRADWVALGQRAGFTAEHMHAHDC